LVPRNKPHPMQSMSLSQNCRTLRAPINVMEQPSRGHWWPTGHLTQTKPQEKGKFTLNTTQRASFSEASSASQGHLNDRPRGRHGSNPNIEPGRGILPSNKPRNALPAGSVKERISFQHHYRGNQPIRGKRHGTFVWDQMVEDSTGNQVVSDPWNNRDIYKTNSKKLVPFQEFEQQQPQPQQLKQAN